MGFGFLSGCIEQLIELIGRNGLLGQWTKNVLKAEMDAEMTEYLGYDKHDCGGHGRGKSSAARGRRWCWPRCT
jgi:hypothetical protein